ncbi:hypothetical protein C4K88_01270 [Arthrobacter pityocampae]|uniref:STAS domain-containing protein n=1 Tax=Arthrobacter pityocampae TaxID=547334 RepID=A0A2S5J184_9MICC|nr:hypothetical protein [Arthrobacter pityocampae]PPB50555.1 hypothetical protein C4K88_01270 [Arthrobacter pityocampae]
MSHKLRITLKLDLDLRQARMEVHGCLTEQNCHALLPIIRRCFRMLRDPRVVIDTSKAQHIDAEGIDALRRLGVGEADHTASDLPGFCSLVVPDALPACPARDPRLHGGHLYAS